MSYYYVHKEGLTNELAQLIMSAQQYASDLITFDEYWIYLYEILPKTDLQEDWRTLKEKGISFVKPLSDW